MTTRRFDRASFIASLGVVVRALRDELQPLRNGCFRCCDALLQLALVKLNQRFLNRLLPVRVFQIVEMISQFN
jgi:hypothetical protein